MKLHEAIIELYKIDNKGVWVRPKCWIGSGLAFCLSHDTFSMELVPGRRGGESHMASDVKSLIDDWEVVSPDQVLDGN